MARDELSDEVAAVYDFVAADFARRNAAMPEAVALLAERLLARLPEAPRILDAGCGAGRDMAWLEERGAELVGADLSAGMLAEARTRARGGLVRADLRSLPFADASFDAVWCMASLLHLPKADAPLALAEVRRVLRPGGVLALGVKEGEGEGWEAAPGWPDRFFARYGAEELAALVAGAGLEPEPVERSSGPRDRWLHVLATTRWARRSPGATGSP